MPPDSHRKEVRMYEKKGPEQVQEGMGKRLV